MTKILFPCFIWHDKKKKKLQSNIYDFSCCREQIWSIKLKTTFTRIQVGTHICLMLPIYAGNETAFLVKSGKHDFRWQRQSHKNFCINLHKLITDSKSANQSPKIVFQNLTSVRFSSRVHSPTSDPWDRHWVEMSGHWAPAPFMYFSPG